MPRPIFAAGLFLFGALLVTWMSSSQSPQLSVAQEKAPIASTEIALRDVKSDVTLLQDKAADQAHAMSGVAYHFNNMWFAADAKNWPLAEFYLNETRSNLRWAVRIIPVRKNEAGQEIKLGLILEAVENSALERLRSAIDDKDHERFVAAYRFTIEAGCYACHKASDKPYLRPKIPDRPAESSINFDPNAEWPK